MVDILLAHGVRNAAAFLSECGVLLFFFHHVGNRERDVRWWLGCAALLIIVPLYVPDLGTELALHASVQGFAMQAGRMLAYWGAVFGCLFGHKDYDVRDSVYWAGFVTVLYLTVQSLRTVLMTATQLAGIPEEYAGIATYGAVLAEWVMVWVVRRQIRPEEPPGEGWRARWFQLLIALFLQLYVKWSLIVMDSGAATVAYRGSSVIFGLLAALGIAQSLVSLEVNLRMRTERTRLQIERVSLDYEIQNAKRALQTDRDMQRLYRETFQSEEGRKKRKKGIKAFFCITLVLTLLVSILNWGIITGWGNVKVERLTLSGYNGDQISALLYIPENATNETPAPLIFNCHGNAGNGRNHESWAVEFARRGFVVLSVDLYGSGDSENSAESFASMAMLTSVTDAFYEHMMNRDYVDPDNILIAAHSMGGSVAAGLAGKYHPKGIMSASGALGSQFSGVEGSEERVEMIGTYVGNVLLDYGDVEQDEAGVCAIVQAWLDSRVGYDGYEGIEYTEVGQIVGSFEEGNAVVGLRDTNRVHEAAFVSQETIGNLLWFAQEVFGDAVPNYIDPSDQIWMYKDYVGLAGIFIFGLFICALALLLIEAVPFFADVKRVRARNIGLRKGGLVISMVLGLIFPYIVLKTNGLGLISAIGMTNMPPTCVGSPGFRLTYSNMAFCTLIGLNLLGLLGFALYFFTDGKRHKLTLNDLGLTPGDSNRLSGKMIGKTILLSAIVVAIAWAMLALQEEVLGTTFYAWFFGFKSLYLPKVQYYVWYILIWILCFVVASFSINVERRLPTTGNETLDTVLAMVFNVVMASFTLVLVISVDWILSSYGVKDRAWIFTFGTDITRLWGMPAGMAVGVAGSTLLYRKTGNTWLSAILMGTVAALMCTTYGQVRIFS